MTETTDPAESPSPATEAVAPVPATRAEPADLADSDPVDRPAEAEAKIDEVPADEVGGFGLTQPDDPINPAPAAPIAAESAPVDVAVEPTAAPETEAPAEITLESFASDDDGTPPEAEPVERAEAVPEVPAVVADPRGESPAAAAAPEPEVLAPIEPAPIDPVMAARAGTRIVVAIKYLHERWGGAERMACVTANILVELGYSVALSVFEPNGPRVMFDLDPRVQITNTSNAKYPTAPNVLEAVASAGLLAADDPAITAEFQGWAKENTFAISWASGIMALEPSLVIAYLPHTYMPLLYTLGRTIPVIASFENDPALEFVRFLGNRDTEAKRALYWGILGRAAGIKALHRPFVDEIAPFFGGRIFLVPNFTERASLHLIPTKRQRVFAGGRLAEVKGFEVLIDAMKIVASRYPNCLLTLYGDGELRDKLAKQIKRLWLQYNVVLCGFSEKLDLPMAQSQLSVVPSTIEGFGLVALEAMAAGLPVVAFRDCRPVAHLVEDGGAGIVVDTRSPESLAAAILALFDDPPLAKALGEAGRLYAEGYSKEAYSENVLQMVTDTLADAV
jgi:glycosyltransferase involved in cell wall biosynthesis